MWKWIAAAVVGGGILLASSKSKAEPEPKPPGPIPPMPPRPPDPDAPEGFSGEFRGFVYKVWAVRDPGFAYTWGSEVQIKTDPITWRLVQGSPWLGTGPGFESATDAENAAQALINEGISEGF